MNIPKNIFENSRVLKHLNDRNIYDQYVKAKQYLLIGYAKKVKFGLKNPKSLGIWYFRINNQYRALGCFDKSGDLLIYGIDNHQN